MKNKQINKFLLMFFLSFTLFFSVSNAEFSETTSVSAGNFSLTANNSSAGGQAIKFGDYNFYDFLNYAVSYVEGGCEDAEAGIVTNYHNIYDYLTDNGYSVIVSSDGKKIIVGPSSVDFGYIESSNKLYYYANSGDILYYAKRDTDMYRFFTITCTTTGYTQNFGSSVISLSAPTQEYFCNKNIKNIYISAGCFWDGSYFYEAPSSDSEIPTLTDAEFALMLDFITSSELFYQHIPSDYRNNFYIQYDVSSFNYLFYFYPSNYQVNGLRRNENDYHIVCDKDFSWWDNIVDFFKKTFTRESENLDYKMIYVKVLEDGTYSCWYRSKSMLSVDETLFNFDLNPIVYSSVEIPFYGKHGGGGINIDTGDVTLSTGPEFVINDQEYGESNIVYNPTPIETVSGEQSFWDKVVNRLSSIVSNVNDIPNHLIEKLQGINGFKTMISFALPLITGITTIIGVLISSIALISRAVTFVYTLPTIDPSSALFKVDVASSSNGLSFVGHNWGSKFLEGLDMLRNFSWNGLNLWNLFSAFVAAMFAIQVVKYVRKHYHY